MPPPDTTRTTSTTLKFEVSLTYLDLGICYSVYGHSEMALIGLGDAALAPEELVQKYETEGLLPLRLDHPNAFYSFKEEVGRGKFAVVKGCQDVTTQKDFVAKLIRYDEEDREDAVQEFSVHRGIDCNQVVRLHNAFLLRSYLVLIMDRLDGEDVLKFMSSKTKVTEEDAALVIRGILNALCYLHELNIVHLDIRPANIMVQGSDVKLIDFGNARKLKSRHGEVGVVVGNPSFTAPEVLSFEPVNMAADMWSVGIVTYALLSGQLPFPGDNDDAVEEAVKQARCTFVGRAFRSLTDHSKGFIEKLLYKIPSKRLEVAGALTHEWLSSLNARRRKMSELSTENLKVLYEQLTEEEEEEMITASCVLRTFDQDPYDSPEEEDEKEEEGN